MTSRGVADVVFCLDASSSMVPCIEGVKGHIADFVEGLRGDGQVSWDLRLDFLAHSVMRGFCARTLGAEDALETLYHGRGQVLFTADTEKFCSALDSVTANGDEAGLFALDCSLDFPWRAASKCHRAVVMMTDEPFEGGAYVSEQRSGVQDLVTKIQAQRVMLYLVAPPSEVYDEIAAADRSEYHAVDTSGNGLAGVDFAEVLAYIGKSVSRSVLQAGAPRAPRRALFGQSGWPARGAQAGRTCHEVMT